MAALDTSTPIAVIGAGTMGAGVAQVAAAAGHPVLLFDVARGAAQQGINNTARGLERLVERGRMSAQQRDELVSRITPIDKIEELVPAGLFIEAIVENLEIKQKLFQQLEQIGGEQAILASNTSSISITAIGAALQRPQRLLGMHFFNPAPIMKLVEIISGLASDSELAHTLYETAIAWGKQAVHARSTPGFIVNRVARPFYAEGLRLMQEGAADPATIDAIVRDCGGFRMGPFELMDLIGHDVNYAVTCSVFDAYYGDQRFLPSLIQKELVDGGYLGRKSGRGFYDYAQDAIKPEAMVYHACASSAKATIVGESELANAFSELLTEAGIEVVKTPGELFAIQTQNATMMLSDGRMASVRAEVEDIENLVLLDLAQDYAATPRLVIAAADQTSSQALEEMIGLLQKTGKHISCIDDVAGLCVMRTICMLVNEGADAVNQQVCSIEDVDIAMRGGVNYPIGPLNWADRIGLGTVLDVLDNLFENYGEDRYRASPLILRRVAAGRGFYV